MMSKFKKAMDSSRIKSKYITTDELESISMLKKLIKETTIFVTCMGLYNHGKSTLLNALIGDYKNKTFKTADIRETSVNKAIQYGNIKFIDTPGLNAKEYDDKRVMDAVKKSDINLFVHTVTTGEFVKKEIEFLNNVKKHWENPQEFINRTIFVVSRVDKATNEEDIANTINKMSKQILNIFNTNATIIPVSAIRYTKGKLENKKLMVKKSNIEILEEMIKNLSDELSESIRETRKKRLKNKYDNLIKQLNSKVQLNKLEISKQKQAQEKYLNELNKDIKKIESTLINMHSRLREA